MAWEASGEENYTVCSLVRDVCFTAGNMSFITLQRLLHENLTIAYRLQPFAPCNDYPSAICPNLAFNINVNRF